MSIKAGSIAVVGLPNAGKSTLVNSLVGCKVSIVSSKPQTTRKRVTGIYQDKESQILFIDAPGRVHNQKGLNSFIQKEYQKVLTECDAVLVVLNIDSTDLDQLTKTLDEVIALNKPYLVVVNKCDVKKAHRMDILSAELRDRQSPFVFVSALKRPEELVPKIIPQLKELLADWPSPLYDSEHYTLETQRQMAAEVIREKCFENLHQEIPFGLAVRILRFAEATKGPTKIYAEILVAKDNHKSIVIGQKGKALKHIGIESRSDIEELLGEKVFLDLHVSAQKGWVKNNKLLQELGYVTD